MKKIIAVILLAASSTACVAAPNRVLEARQTLKDYGLSRCLLEAYPQQASFTEDLKAASRAYHFMGSGAHGIRQNEDTLETLHDPYAVIDEYVRQAFTRKKVVMKHDGENAFARCLEVYQLPEFDELVRRQDEYIGREP